MHSYLVTAPSVDARRSYITGQESLLGISAHDEVTIISETDSFGISDIRNFIARLSLKPVSGHRTAGVILEADRLTPEAQQALLKTLEEPPESAVIFLGTANPANFPATITSRCLIISCTDTTPEFSVKEMTDTGEIIRSLIHASAGKKISIISGLGSSKDDALWIRSAMAALYGEIHGKITGKIQPANDLQALSAFLRGLLTASKSLDNNVSPLHLLEQAVLSII